MSVYHDLMALSETARETVLDEVDAIPDHVLDDEYRDMLNECCEPFTSGRLSFPFARVLEELDPVAYRCGFADFVGDEDQFTEIGGHTYRTEALEKALEDYNDSL